MSIRKWKRHVSIDFHARRVPSAKVRFSRHSFCEQVAAAATESPAMRPRGCEGSRPTRFFDVGDFMIGAFIMVSLNYVERPNSDTDAGSRSDNVLLNLHRAVICFDYRAKSLPKVGC